eukprot:CAMPEP_0181300688 /NCGR_PEP_ID=MMETSP1101-20121128/7023_1 /TAXON_ID=46948 /ORGANISM="Rhodomonas abbreviata, Strain Caron Lab Isolate" /LENGTH=284 /DNA_ID=CAMNT_0023405941 /DNA_START=46 /DNA_END=897 /DNA_ORIENTATION=-
MSADSDSAEEGTSRPKRTILQLKVGPEAAGGMLMTKWLLRTPAANVCVCGALGDEELCECDAIVQRIVSRGEVVLNGRRISNETQNVKEGDSLRLTRVEKPTAALEQDAEDDVLSQEVAMLLSMLGNEHKAYWNSRYTCELDAVDHAERDEGEDPMEKLFVWFGKMAMLMTVQTITSDITPLDLQTARCLDVGCGNGFFCEVLHAVGCANVLGVDYSPAAIRLSKRIQRHFRNQKPTAQSWGTRYLLDDILCTRLPREAFDLVHDSGTLDSIAMTLPSQHPPLD